ncbi:hypothetical protein DL771_001137 [Monosporascus sp. 5C6A]|nr:hypothetical protein DL771_001137 [Monosporascus sp. 5C6A]
MDNLYHRLSVRKEPQSSGLSIRLLTIPARLRDDTNIISCRLSVHTLASCPEYLALSYCWGDAKVKKSVRCNEVELPVTANLFSALECLCYPDKDMLIWIDAICINQDDSAEKEEQVGIMRDIYSKALEVLIWLGPAADESDLGIKACQNLALAMADFICQQADDEDEPDDPISQVRAEFAIQRGSLEYRMAEDAKLRRKWRKLKKLFTDFKPKRLSEREVRAIRAIVSRPWWTRIWIVQELCLAKRARIIIGQSSIEWKAFSQAVDVASYHHPASLGLARSAFFILSDLKNDWDFARHGEAEFPNLTTELDSLLLLLARLRWNQATDARDKVYAILGLAKHGSALPANYQVTVAETYQNAAFTIIQETGSLDVLAHCLRPRLSIPSKLHLPSWVPDWSYDKTHLPRSHDTVCMDSGVMQMKRYQAIGSKQNGHHDRATPRLLHGNVLALDGVVLDHIAILSPEISWTLFNPHPSGPAVQLYDDIIHQGPPFTWPPLLNNICCLIIHTPIMCLQAVKSLYHFGALFDIFLNYYELAGSAQIMGDKLGHAAILVSTMNWGVLPEHDTISRASRLCRQRQYACRYLVFHIIRWLRLHMIFPFWYNVSLGLSIYLAILMDLISHLLGSYPGASIDESTSYTAFTSPDSEFRLIPNLFAGAVDYRLGKTRTGRIALVPFCTRAQDRIALLKGGRSPFVVRPAEMRWEIIGACFVYGMANSDHNGYVEMEFV